MTQTITKNLTKTLLVLASLGLLLLPLSVDAQEDTQVQVSVNSVITAFTTSGTVVLGALTPDATGTQSIASDTVSVTTNDVDGFTLTMEDQDADVTLSNGNGDSFAASAGTPAAPITLVNNTWGWRVDALSSFGAGPTNTLNNAAPSALTFAGVPTNGNAVTINSTSSNGTDAVSVWYSARANDSQPEGIYTDIVTYTATANP